MDSGVRKMCKYSVPSNAYYSDSEECYVTIWECTHKNNVTEKCSTENCPLTDIDSCLRCPLYSGLDSNHCLRSYFRGDMQCKNFQTIRNIDFVAI